MSYFTPHWKIPITAIRARSKLRLHESVAVVQISSNLWKTLLELSSLVNLILIYYLPIPFNNTNIILSSFFFFLKHLLFCNVVVVVVALIFAGDCTIMWVCMYIYIDLFSAFLSLSLRLSSNQVEELLSSSWATSEHTQHATCNSRATRFLVTNRC